LVRAFADYDQIPKQDVLGPAAGSVYYAYDPTTGTYWALATMEPRTPLPVPVLVKFQDGANRAVYRRTNGSAWSVVRLVGEPPCLARAGLPLAIESLWGLADPPECAPAPGTPVGATPVDRAIEVYGNCATASLEPTTIVLTCADYGWILEGLHWTSWSNTAATGTATFVYNDCSPDCALGHCHQVPDTRVTLTDPVVGAGGQLVWSRLQQSPEPPGYETGPLHGGPFPLPTRPI
jgi:hypothetical protein